MMTSDDEEETDDEEKIDDEEEDEDEGSASDEEPFILGSDEGEVLELSEGTEPESESSPEPEPRLPSPSSSKPKKRRISEASVAPAKKAKRVSFARNIPDGKEERNIRGGKKGKGRK